MSIYASYTDTAIIAHFYHEAGLAILPLRLDGSKAPLCAWGVYSWDELAPYFNRTYPCGIGILCGARSGGLEVLDFDCHHNPSVYPQWASMVDTALLSTLPIIATPSDGRHVWYQCSAMEGNQVLARDANKNTTIETRAEGGYIVACGSPFAVHSTGKPYDLLQGNPLHVPTITPEQRAELHRVSRQFNQYTPPPPKPTRSIPIPARRGLPGDVFNATAAWEEILEPKGWTIAKVKGDKIYWTKPDAKRGECHATTGHGEANVFYCFSANASPFEPEQSYNKFSAYAHLYHGGDYRKAAQAIRDKQNKHSIRGESDDQ